MTQIGLLKPISVPTMYLTWHKGQDWWSLVNYLEALAPLSSKRDKNKPLQSFFYKADSTMLKIQYTWQIIQYNVTLIYLKV